MRGKVEVREATKGFISVKSVCTKRDTGAHWRKRHPHPHHLRKGAISLTAHELSHLSHSPRKPTRIDSPRRDTSGKVVLRVG